MPPASPLPSVAVVLDRHHDVLHTHTALAAHHPPSGRITLHPGPGTTSETGLAHDLLVALGKPPLLPGRFPGGRQPAWEAATAWMSALGVPRLTVLRAHRPPHDAPSAAKGPHRYAPDPGLPPPPPARRPAPGLQTADYSVTAGLEAARRHYYGTPIAEPPPADELAAPASRWLTLPALDRLVSYDSPRPCAAPCTPPPIAWRHRPPPVPLTAPTAQRVAHRLHAATAHPRLAAAVTAALFTGASLQQLATARPRDYDTAAATLAPHDRARYTDGCAAYPVPPWAGIFLRAAACFTRLVSGEDQELLAAPGDRGHLLRVAETARLRPPQPPAARRKGPAGRVEWDWRERQEAEKYEAVPARRVRPSRR